jgi:hypothetical protein
MDLRAAGWQQRGQLCGQPRSSGKRGQPWRPPVAGSGRSPRRHRSARGRLADWLLPLAGRGARRWVRRIMPGLAGSVADGCDRLTERLPPLSSEAEQQNVREFSRVPLGSRGGLAHRTYVRETRRAREGRPRRLQVTCPAVNVAGNVAGNFAAHRVCMGDEAHLLVWVSVGVWARPATNGAKVRCRGEGPGATIGPGSWKSIRESLWVPLVSACFLAHRRCVRTIFRTQACASWVNRHHRAGNLPARPAGRGSSW